MDVEVKPFASLKRRQPMDGKVQLAAGSRVSDLLATLGIATDDVGILVVNREDGRFDQVLHDGDVVTLIPPIAGG
jgi:molybdopterin converting factor small subunit